jgi:hypothetical protein
VNDRRLRVPEDVIHRDLDGEAVILNLKSGTYFGLDPVGTRMWALISDLREPAKVLEALLSEYDVEEDRLRADLDHLIGQLVSHGLLEVSNDLPPDGGSR